MNLKQYEAFVKTVEYGSLTKAAQALNSTQSRISHILSEIEEECGFTVLHRNRNGIKLTDAGAMLYPVMQDILQKNHELNSLVNEVRTANTGTIRLGTFTSVAVHWLPGMIQEFQKTHPKIEFRMFNGDYYDINQWLKDGTIDIAFVALLAPEGTKTIPLAEDELVAILPKGHPLSEKEQVSIKDIAQEPFISLLQSSNHDIQRALEGSGITPNVKFSTKDDYAIIAMVEQHLGVSIVPELLLLDHANKVEVRPLVPRAARTIALAMRSDRIHIPAIETFAQAAQEWLTTKAPFNKET